ncbi:MAG: DUF4912 domain-containing protein, partial [Elusimicrobia bacterium]|nr:DUF4912 domain-containing protein [Elusimicrobiota bacterium]
TYWEISAGVRRKLKKQHGSRIFSRGLTLRVYDVTDIKFDGTNAHGDFDVSVDASADNWYVNIPEANRTWCVDLGVVLANGKFVLIARSNIVNMPRYGVSPITDEKWGILQKEFERLLELSGVEHIGKSSFDVTRLMRERWEQIISISSARMPFSPKGISSFRQQPPVEEYPKERKFWLKANTELIVYGTTESDATLSVAGEKVKLKSDGSFSLRLELPDGKKEIPIKAVSPDRKMRKQIKFSVSRKTE